MPQFIYVVARDRRDLYESLRAEFAGQQDVVVTLDRRRGERRRSTRGSAVDTRRGDRRQQSELDGELHTVGSFITACDGMVLIEMR